MAPIDIGVRCDQHPPVAELAQFRVLEGVLQPQDLLQIPDFLVLRELLCRCVRHVQKFTLRGSQSLHIRLENYRNVHSTTFHFMALVLFGYSPSDLAVARVLVDFEPYS